MAMIARLFALNLLLVFLTTAIAEEPECPLLKCQGGSKVACFFNDESCGCRCVTDDDPCASLHQINCPPGSFLNCTTEYITCKCRCAS
ncbi:uncharacterized protein LOC144150275 [Haemaphysalis longicornis]